MRRGVLLVMLALAAACSAEGPGLNAGDTWVGTITTNGNVTTVVNESGSVWGGTARLVEEASIGVDAGEDAYMFGQVRAVAASEDEIYVLDDQVALIRVFDRNGRHLRDLGKAGSGPGEFRSPESMVIDPDGRIYVRDPGNGRIMVLSPLGDEVGIIPLANARLQTTTPMVMTTGGRLYNPERIRTDGGRVLFGRLPLVPRSLEGSQEGQPIVAPDFGFDSAAWQVEGSSANRQSTMGIPFAPFEVWAFSPSGSVLGGVSEDYSFEVRHPDGQTTRVIKSWDPVPVAAEEGEWFKGSVTAFMRNRFPGWTWNGREPPARKPAYSQLLGDVSGRIWVRRPGAGYHTSSACDENPLLTNGEVEPCWREYTTWDVFEEEGRFLGAADVPESASWHRYPYIRDDMFLTVTMDVAGTIIVKRYRLVLPREE